MAEADACIQSSLVNSRPFSTPLIDHFPTFSSHSTGYSQHPDGYILNPLFPGSAPAQPTNHPCFYVQLQALRSYISRFYAQEVFRLFERQEINVLIKVIYYPALCLLCQTQNSCVCAAAASNRGNVQRTSPRPSAEVLCSFVKASH